jgi:RsiW-degrading membrane proteinase PrsW (M82 family)
MARIWLTTPRSTGSTPPSPRPDFSCCSVGIIFLFLVQICSNLRIHRFPGPILIKLLLLILTLIGWSYNSANDPNSNFFLSALGFTFGVGLCEEFTKAIPLFFNFRRDSRMGWRGACLWGLASGIGFGVSEGIMYSSRYYNGVSGVDIYLVRFVSCVALHAMWSASVGIAIARNVDEYEDLHDLSGFGLFLLRVMAVPMTLHGFYDTLLKKDMNVWALLVALLSFAWFAWHIELARGAEPDAGRPRTARRRAAY